MGPKRIGGRRGWEDAGRDLRPRRDISAIDQSMSDDVQNVLTHLFGSSKISLCLGEVGIIAFGTLPFMDEAVHLALIALEVGLIKTLALVIQIRASQRHFTDEPFYHSAS